MAKKQTKKTPVKIISQQMPGESNEQYAAFLAYCLMINRSVRDLIRNWSKFDQELAQQNSNIRLGKPVTLTTLLNWSGKYKWQLRAKKWDQEKKDLMSEEFVRIADERGVSVARLFNRIKKYLITQITENRALTVDDFKKAWEMMRTEGGLSTGKQEFDLNQSLEISDDAKEVLELWRKKHDSKQRAKNH